MPECVSRDASHESSTPRTPVPRATGAGLLLLSSDALLQASLAEYLAGRGHRVCDSAQAGVTYGAVIVDADAWPPPWTSRSLRSRFPRTPCIVLSGSPLAGPDTVARLRRGFFLAKPVRPWELARLIAQTADGVDG